MPTEYVEGGHILEVLLDEHRERALSWEEKTQVIKGVAAGLAHAHRHGAIHRDIRPSTTSRRCWRGKARPSTPSCSRRN